MIFAIIISFNKKGFIHDDLHYGNILLKPKRNHEIIYENKILVLNNSKIFIIDFDFDFDFLK